ncbi:AMP-binding protein, partial [Klebsiella pneumoniae]|nr:AMP-binding protein [Klebsiella pneumoniae]
RATEYPRDSSVPALFEQVAAASGDVVAVTAADATLTYGELNARANLLARHLRSLGVQPGDRVGLSLPRSSEVPVALLAILKAGA